MSESQRAALAMVRMLEPVDDDPLGEEAMKKKMLERSKRTVWACSHDFGVRLKQARLAAGLGQRELAFHGCSSAYISRIESGQRWPSRQVIDKLAEGCNVRGDWLAWGKGPRERDYDARADVRVLLGLPTAVSADEHLQARTRLSEWAEV